MPSYRSRIDAIEGLTDEKMIEFFKHKSITRFLIVHHTTTTENPHYHTYCETHITIGNFSNKIKKDLKVSGTDYSNKKCDDDRKNEYLSYLFNTKKGNVPRIVLYDGFSPIDIAIYQENAATVAKEFKEKLTQSKKAQIDIAMIVGERTNSSDVTVIYDLVIDVLKQNRMMARPNHVKDIIATVMAYSQNPHAKSQIKQMTLRFFSN